MQDMKAIEKSGRSYVYICYIKDLPVYVGKGTGKRWRHCISGKSTNPDLNKAFFEHGESGMRVEIVEQNLDDHVAYDVEKYWIKMILAEGYELFNFLSPNLTKDSEWLKEQFIFGLPEDMLQVPDWVTEPLI